MPFPDDSPLHLPDPLTASTADGLPPVSPDIIEQDMPETLDNMIPTRGYQMIPMVGIGGSAGGLAALKAFFEAMPADPGLVFVVISHLSPEHESNLPALLGRYTSMPVLQVREGLRVEVNTVYVIPPSKHLLTVDGHLRLIHLEREHGKRVAVDLFFRSLADTHGPHATAIVLSGGDGDGAIGIRRIKERGGLTIAQDPDEAEHNGMPRAAISTGMVDWVLRAADMPARILGYYRMEERLKLPPEDGPEPSARVTRTDGEAALRDVLTFVRMRTGRDFSCYKRATILRRISRRMQVNGVTDLTSYLAFLRTHAGEAGALLNDLLISVTNFFRDREAFEELEKRLPALFAGKTQADTIRFWVPACATGEEAYSLAIMAIEHARTMDFPPGIQVFGCDLDEEAIQIARHGVYPEAIAADVSPERLRRYFNKEHNGYRVRREVRETVLFAAHDILKDAPFSRMDLISCRNLLIYLQREAQARVLDTFHFSLRPDGLLFLGTSESIDEGSPLFRVVDKTHRIFAPKIVARIGLPVPKEPSTLVRRIEERRADQGPILPGPLFLHSAAVPLPGLRVPQPKEEDRMSWTEMHFKLIERFSPPSLVVNAEQDIQHMSASAGQFLQITGGQPTTNLMRLVHPSLRVELRTLLFRAMQSGAPAESLRVPMQQGDSHIAVDLRVCPADDIAPGHLLVVFTAHSDKEPTRESGTHGDEPLVQHMERELEQMKDHLRDTIEQYEASNEELKASNEELQAMNEELRSATEELETSREELQSINEELSTVNSELKEKVDELGHTNSDLQNLMASTAIATVFLDRDLRITRFTPTATTIFRLIPGDIGRPLADLQHHLQYPDLRRDAESVLERLVPVEREVEEVTGRSYLARLLPYRTLEDRIAGVVLTFVDITERRRAEQAVADDLHDTDLLLKVSERLIPEGNVQGLFDDLVDAAIKLMRADGGTLQLLHPTTQDLRILSSKGLERSLTDAYATVTAASGTSCGQALAQGRRFIVSFDSDLPDPDGSLAKHRDAGLACAQSTPLIARSGRPIGMLSTHWRKHHRPTDRELRFLDLLGRQTADSIERIQADDALRDQMGELTRFTTAVVGRESRMIELKQEVNDLCDRLKEKHRYKIAPESDS